MTQKERMESLFGPQNPDDNYFTAKARLLQSIHRVHIGEIAMGVGPTEHAIRNDTHEPDYYGNMLFNGENTGKNFLFPETFEYAKKRVDKINKMAEETIDSYRLFNNMLSSMPMTFNLFHPLMMIKEKYPEELDAMFKGAFPLFDIHHVNEILIEFIPISTANYTNDKKAMDAAILFTDSKGHKCIIAIETKYADCLGMNVANDNDQKYKITSASGMFTAEGLEQVKNDCTQIYRNFLMTEKYRMVLDLKESYSVLMAPRGHPTTDAEIKSLKKSLKPKYQYKIRFYSLEDFLDALYERCPYDFLDWIGLFKERYLHFDTINLVK